MITKEIYGVFHLNQYKISNQKSLDWLLRLYDLIRQSDVLMYFVLKIGNSHLINLSTFRCIMIASSLDRGKAVSQVNFKYTQTFCNKHTDKVWSINGPHSICLYRLYISTALEVLFHTSFVLLDTWRFKWFFKIFSQRSISLSKPTTQTTLGRREKYFLVLIYVYYIKFCVTVLDYS